MTMYCCLFVSLLAETIIGDNRLVIIMVHVRMILLPVTERPVPSWTASLGLHALSNFFWFSRFFSSNSNYFSLKRDRNAYKFGSDNTFATPQEKRRKKQQTIQQRQQDE